MRKISLTLIAALASFCSYAQNSNPWPTTGNVGIGTNTPISLLQLVRNAAGAQGPILELTNSGTGEGATSEIFFSTYTRQPGNPSARIRVQDNGDWGGDFYFDTKTTAPNGDLITQMFIDAASGSIGMGTTEPDAAYKLSVNGNIRAKMVKVETGWADYVFKKDYKLRSLINLRRYIQTNNHLPDVPSAAEVKKNGVDLGATEAVLLKKVEELTLYLIEKDKKDRQQQAQIDQLTRRLKIISKKVQE